MQPVYKHAFCARTPKRRQLVKAADKLSAYIKCVEELKAGNNEFRDAATQTRAALEGYGLPEVAYFMETFLPQLFPDAGPTEVAVEAAAKSRRAEIQKKQKGMTSVMPFC